MVEDDEAIGEPLANGLRREGFDVTLVQTATAAMSAPPTGTIPTTISCTWRFLWRSRQRARAVTRPQPTGPT